MLYAQVQNYDNKVFSGLSLNRFSSKKSSNTNLH